MTEPAPLLGDEFHYRLDWRPASGMPGQHRSSTPGDGFEFDAHIPLGDGADPRRFDLLGSLRDPMQRVLVRRFRQTSAIGLIVLADLSASMCVQRRIRKLDLLIQLVRASAFSAYRNGDAFGFYGCSETTIDDYTVPLTRARSVGPTLADKLARYNQVGRSAQGLLQAAALLPNRRAMVILVSDFYLPPALLDELLDRLGRHMVVPVLLVDSAETRTPPEIGLTRLLDAESGEQRTYFMRPALKRNYMAAFAAHRSRIQRACHQRGYPPLVMTDRFSSDAISQYFLER